MLPSVFKPQVWALPALTDVKLPLGGVAWPKSLTPQQAMLPSLFKPQV
jgi:hypothetical protein